MAAEMTAERLGSAARFDMQLSVPTSPVARSGTRLRRSGDSVVLDGSDRVQVFTGGFARETLVSLVAACDGRRSHSDLAAELGVDEGAVFKCLALLASAGVIEEAPRDGVDADPGWRVLLSRLGNSTGANPSWTDAVDRASAQVLRLVGDPELVAALRHAAPHLRYADAASAPTTPDGPPPITVHVHAGADADGASEVAARCWDDGIPFLRVLVGDEEIAIGPYVLPGVTPCLDCAPPAGPQGPGRPSPSTVDLAAGLTAHHLTALVTRAVATCLPGDASSTDPSTLVTRYLPVVSRPGCPRCSVSSGPVGPTPAGARYEASVALPPRKFLAPRDHQAHYYAGNIGLQSKFKEWPSRTRIDLPAPDLSRLRGRAVPAGERSSEPLDLSDLSLLLATAFGIKDGDTTAEVTRRWTAAAGNIGCTTAYVISRDGGPLPRGVHGYAPRAHALAGITSRVPPGRAACEIVVTGDLTKIMTKYGTFGFRLVFLDAGCALATLRRVAGHVGILATPSVDWDDDALLDVLSGSTADEPIVAVATLGDTA